MFQDSRHSRLETIVISRRHPRSQQRQPAQSRSRPRTTDQSGNGCAARHFPGRHPPICHVVAPGVERANSRPVARSDGDFGCARPRGAGNSRFRQDTYPFGRPSRTGRDAFHSEETCAESVELALAVEREAFGDTNGKRYCRNTFAPAERTTNHTTPRRAMTPHFSP